MNTTIIYYTNNRLDQKIFNVCVKNLKQSIFPVVSVSHKPMDLGNNICVGEQKSSWLTLYKQLKIGLENASTRYVAMAEHDCLYTDAHFSFIPKRDDVFYYNENVWLVQWSKNGHNELNGMYSRYWKQRLALSQLICDRKLLLESVNAKLDIIEKRCMNQLKNIGEPGLTSVKKWASSGRPVFLKKYFKDHLEKETYETFLSDIPNLDIRHDNNFTGPKRGRHRRYKIKHWGRFDKLIEENHGRL